MKSSINEIDPDDEKDIYDIDELGYEESTSKFGRKFNESDDEIGDAVQDAYDKYRACSTEPKVCHAVKINADGTEEKVGISMTHGNSIGGIVKAIKDGRLRKVLKFSESSGKFGKKFKESLTGRNDIQDNLAAALDAEIRNLKPEDVQFVSESAIDETSVGIIVTLLHSVLTSGELTEEQKMKLMDTKPALLKEMVLALIDKLLPNTQGYQVLALGLTRAAVQEMTDVDWRDVLKYTLDNLDNLG